MGLQKLLLIITLAAVFTSCSNLKHHSTERKIANFEDESSNQYNYLTSDRNYWSPEQDYNNSDLVRVNNIIRNEFSLSKFQTILKGKAGVSLNNTPRVFGCEVKIFDFSKKPEKENKIVILLEVRNHENHVLPEFSKSFSTAEDLKSIKKVGEYPRSIRVVLYRPYGSPNHTTDLKLFKGADESFINIVTNTPITFDKNGVTCEF